MNMGGALHGMQAPTLFRPEEKEVETDTLHGFLGGTNNDHPFRPIGSFSPFLTKSCSIQYTVVIQCFSRIGTGVRVFERMAMLVRAQILIRLEFQSNMMYY